MNRNTFDTIKSLLRKYIQEDLSKQEQQQLDAWVAESVENRRFFERLSSAGNFEREFRQFASSKEKILSALHQQIPVLKKQPAVIHRSSFMHRWLTAAAILLLLAGGAYLWTINKQNAEPISIAGKTADIAPGKDGAILTLADGTQVVLDSLGNGVIATQNGAEVVLQDGRLAYDPTGESAQGLVYNTMTTPKGRQFRLQLPDGTGVWLNAASSISYPTMFNGKQRQVKITGEAYFEVAKNEKMPFRVQVGDLMEVEVLGTHFNVNAYSDEANISTTLIEGSVRISQMEGQTGEARTENSVILKPGQQAQMVSSAIAATPARKPAFPQSVRLLNDAEIDKVMAWKNGAFNFNDASLQEVMRQLERWYDIKVIYEKGVPDIRFVGEMSRGVSLADLIRGLEGLGIRFRIEEGRKLVVMP